MHNRDESDSQIEPPHAVAPVEYRFSNEYIPTRMLALRPMLLKLKPLTIATLDPDDGKFEKKPSCNKLMTLIVS